MPDALAAALLALGGRLLIDGGLATQLEVQGNDLSDALWSARLLLEAPDEIEAAHLAFFRAGARVATTASYQATFEGFGRRGIDRERAAGLLRRSVTLAAGARTRYREERAAAGRPDPGPLLVAASIGPFGAMLADGSEYRGRYGRTVSELRDFHRERLEVLAEAGADLLACETTPELEEAEALAGLLTETPGAAGWLAFSCADGARLWSGATVEAAAAVADASPGVLAVGVNCTAPEHMEELVSRMRSVTAKPIVAYPNSGEGWDAVARRWMPGSSPRVDPAAVRRWTEAGASVVGGCCRVSPDQIALLAPMLSPATS